MSLTVSRNSFLYSVTSTAFLPLGVTVAATKTPTSLSLPLLFLPKSGCVAVLVEVNGKQFVYVALVDTGSPFWTAPAEVEAFSKQNEFAATSEQYGQAVGEMTWQTVSAVTLCDNRTRPHNFRNIIMGVPSDNVVDETGGIYLGLLAHDQFRPTVMEQLGYSSFCLDYVNSMLTLSKTNLIGKQDNMSMDLFDFSPYGSNVYHYGVICSELELQIASKTTLRVTCSSLSRPVVVVLDSGLTGCIVSDSLYNELVERQSNFDLQEIQGARLTTRHASLNSNPKYWMVSSFRLPWFDLDETNHPHVIAAGATFLSQSKMTIDTQSRRVSLEC